MGQANTEDPCGRCSTPGRVRLGHEVGEGSDRWAPPVGDSGAQDPLVSGKKRGGMLAWEGKLGRGCRLGQREEERGEGKVWAFGPISREREEEKINTFSILFSNL